MQCNKRVKFYTLGCKVNQYETQGIREKFLYAGFRENNSEIADVYIVNTCTVTARADRESRRLIRKALRSNLKSKIVVTGCYIEKDASELLRISDRVQIVPNRQKHRIVNLLNSTHDACLPARLTAKPWARQARRTTHNETFLPLRISDFKDRERAFVKIQDGCNNFCSYCKVPLVRGVSRSRSPKEIIAEVERLTRRGFKEVVLTGICLGSYHYKSFDLVAVLNALENIKGKFRIRLSSIEPQLISNDLIGRIADSEKICPHLHIPLQSGDNVILKRMNRRYTRKNYLSLIVKIKKKIKDVAITTDILVGFPGEEEKNFRNTLRSLKEVLPLRSHIFPFSPRQGTAAFNLQERVEPRLIKERTDLLKEIARECSYKFRKGFLGKQLSVLIESQADKENGTLSGYSQNYIKVSVEDAIKEDVNNLIRARVKVVDMYSTKAQRLGRGVARHRGLQSAQQKKARTI